MRPDGRYWRTALRGRTAPAPRTLAITPEPIPRRLDVPHGNGGWGHLRLALWRRIRSGWWVKLVTTTAGISVFFVAYFWILHHPQFALTVVPLSWPDHLIPFEPAALPVYFSLWLYVSLAPALLRDVRELAAYGLACAALGLLGLTVFVVWPTTTPDFAIDWTLHPSIEFLKRVDVAANACPSLHVAFAVLTALRLQRTLAELHAPPALHSINMGWCIAIAWSTIATRQHVAYDVLAGALLGAGVAVVHLRDRLRRDGRAMT